MYALTDLITASSQRASKPNRTAPRHEEAQKISYPALLSVHGTFLAFSLQSREFYTTDSVDGAETIYVSLSGRRAHLFVLDGDGGQVFVAPSNFGHVVSPDAGEHASTVAYLPQEGGFAYFETNGFYLSCNPDRSADLKIYKEIYEKFWLFHANSIVDCILRNTWLSTSMHRIVQPSEIRLEHGFQIMIGEIRCNLTDLADYSYVPGATEVYFIYDNYKAERLSLFNPLIYFCAYGGDESFDLLSMCVRSYETYGSFTGTYMIMTNKDATYVVDKLDFIDRRRLLVKYVPVVDVIDMVCSRFKISGLRNLSSFQPIVYSDFDIVCNADISNFLTEVMCEPMACVKTEGEINLEHYGSVLISDDAHCRAKNRLGFNSGVIAFKNIELVRAEFEMVTKCIYSNLRHGLSRQSTEAYDQPVANYIFNKLSNYNTSVCEKYVHPWPPVENAHITGRGLVHFCGGVGALHKIDRVRSYFDHLAVTSTKGWEPV